VTSDEKDPFDTAPFAGEQSIDVHKHPLMPDLLLYAVDTTVLSSQVRSVIEQHLKSCASCRENLESMSEWQAERDAETRRIFDLPFEDLERELNRIISNNDPIGSVALVDRLIYVVGECGRNSLRAVFMLGSMKEHAPEVSRSNAEGYLRVLSERLLHIH
jgi:hypothetical protein